MDVVGGSNGATPTAAPLTHARLGTTLRLMEADALRQRDLNKYMAAQRDKEVADMGDTVPEFHYRILYAAVKSGIVKEARVADKPEPLTTSDLADLSPARVRWFAMQVNNLYVAVTAIPPEAS